MNSSISIYIYEQCLLGNLKDIASNLSFNTPAAKETAAKDILHFAVEEILNWSPQDLHDNTDFRIIKMLKLDFAINCLNIPPEIDNRLLFEYLATVLYPDIYKYNEMDTVRSLYKRILSGDGPFKIPKFPKDFFTGPRGEARLKTCFRYILMSAPAFDTIEEAYQVFGTAEGAKYLRKYHLYSACESVYEYPLDLLHECLTPSQRNEFLYRKWRFKLEKMLHIRMERKKKRQDESA